MLLTCDVITTQHVRSSHVVIRIPHHFTVCTRLCTNIRVITLGPDLQRLLRGFYEEVTTDEDFTMFAKFTKLYTRNIRRSYETICEKLTSTNYVL